MLGSRSIRRLLSIASVGLFTVMVTLNSQPYLAQAQRTPRPTRSSSTNAGGNTGGNAATGGLAATSTVLAATAKAASQSVALTSTAFMATANAAKGKVTAVPQDEAQASITAYAQTVLGINVTIKSAGGGTGDVNQTGTSKQAQQYAASVAVKTYYAVLSNGAASLSYGSGTLTGDITVDVQDSSLGVFSLLVTGGATSADAALALAKQTFPGVASYTYTPYTMSTGYAWYATGTDSVVDASGKQVKTTAQAVILYVLPGKKGKSTVTATVGRGTFATAIQKP